MEQSIRNELPGCALPIHERGTTQATSVGACLPGEKTGAKAVEIMAIITVGRTCKNLTKAL